MSDEKHHLESEQNHLLQENLGFLGKHMAPSVQDWIAFLFCSPEFFPNRLHLWRVNVGRVLYATFSSSQLCPPGTYFLKGPNATNYACNF